jgi:hypothetical protein
MSKEQAHLLPKKPEPSLWTKIEGAAEIVAGVMLVTNPWAILIVAGAGCAFLTVKKYLDEPRTNEAGHPRTMWERFSGAVGMAFGTGVGMATMVGGAVVALIGAKEAWYGNAASFDMVQGAMWGTAASIAVPAVGLILIAEGGYKAVTGQPCNVISFTYDKVKSGFMAISNFCGITQKPTQENIKVATATIVEEAKEGVANIKAAEAKAKDGVLANMGTAILSVGSTLKAIVTGSPTHADNVSKASPTPSVITTTENSKFQSK